MKYHIDKLNAAVCREIVLQELREGPISVLEAYVKLKEVFPRTDYRAFISALIKKDSGIAIVNGVLERVSSAFPHLLSRLESRKLPKGRSKVFRMRKSA